MWSSGWLELDRGTAGGPEAASCAPLGPEAAGRADAPLGPKAAGRADAPLGPETAGRAGAPVGPETTGCTAGGPEMTACSLKIRVNNALHLH